MSPREKSGKARAIRIPLDYYKKPDRFSKWKTRLCLAALIGTGWWLSGLGWDPRGWSRYEERSRLLATHGPLVRPHAPLDAQCEACHVPFRPVSGEGWAAKLVGDEKVGETRCQACHTTPVHHASEAPTSVQACAACHRDHRGREASLTEIPDTHCTRCHGSLAGHTKGGKPAYAAKITRFDIDHPAFRQTRDGPARDPGTVKFSHALHMSSTFNREPGGKPLKTIGDLTEGDRERYRRPGQGNRDVIQLDCASCHRFDGDDLSAERGGRSPTPITYANECRACHPLDYDPDRPALSMRHGLQPAEVHRTLWGAFAEGQLAAPPNRGPRPIPGREPEMEKAAREAIERKVARMEEVLFGEKRCGECHHYVTPEGRGIPALTRLVEGQDVRIAAADIPQVWLGHATFDHAPHRVVDCKACHAGAYPDAQKPSHTSGDVLLPEVGKCQECHSPRRSVGGREIGGADFRCIECHRYPGGDARHRSVGPLVRDAAIESSLGRFLLGAQETR